MTSFVGRLVSQYTYTYSGRLQSASIDITDNGTSTDAYQETYTFDAAGNLTGDGTHTYLYSSNRLTQTKIGTEVIREFTFDSGMRWRTGEGPSANPDEETYAYTGTGRLSTYADESAGIQATYAYDSVGQRQTSTVTVGSAEDQEVTTTSYTYTGLTLHKLEATRTQGETLESWSLTYLYDEYGKPYAGVYRDTTDENPANWPQPTVFALLTTDRGDVVALLDKNGAPFAAYRYDAWGNPLGQGNISEGIWAQATSQGETEVLSLETATKIATRQPLRYAGYCYDSESGMYYLSARHYVPATRQFLSKDLSRNDGEQSAYGYCLGNPVLGTDPSGYYVVAGGGGGTKEMHTHLVAQSLLRSGRLPKKGLHVYDTTGIPVHDATLSERNEVDANQSGGFLIRMIKGGLQNYGPEKHYPPRWYDGPDPASCIMVEGGKILEPFDNFSNYRQRLVGPELRSTQLEYSSERNSDGSTRFEVRVPGRSPGTREYASLPIQLLIFAGVRDPALADTIGMQVDEWIGVDWSSHEPTILHTYSWDDPK